MTAAVCAWCRTKANMTPLSGCTEIDLGGYPAMKAVQAAFDCNHCHRISVGSTFVHAQDPVPRDYAKTWWEAKKEIHWTPEHVGGKDFPDVPAHIASAADEAFRCRSIESLRAAILMARSVIEATCKEKGVTKGQLAAKIDLMADRNLIRPFTQDAAHELRFLGNDMAHGDFIEPVDTDDADAVLEVMAEILNEVFQGPARVNRMREKRQRPVSVPTKTSVGGGFEGDGSDH